MSWTQVCFANLATLHAYLNDSKKALECPSSRVEKRCAVHIMPWIGASVVKVHWECHRARSGKPDLHAAQARLLPSDELVRVRIVLQ